LHFIKSIHQIKQSITNSFNVFSICLQVVFVEQAISPNFKSASMHSTAFEFEMNDKNNTIERNEIVDFIYFLPKKKKRSQKMNNEIKLKLKLNK